MIASLMARRQSLLTWQTRVSPMSRDDEQTRPDEEQHAVWTRLCPGLHMLPFAKTRKSDKDSPTEFELSFWRSRDLLEVTSLAASCSAKIATRNHCEDLEKTSNGAKRGRFLDSAAPQGIFCDIISSKMAKDLRNHYLDKVTRWTLFPQ
jgi:hypothetical protein